MTLGRNPFELKEPPVKRRDEDWRLYEGAKRLREAEPPIKPEVTPKEREIPDIPYAVKDPYTGKDIDLVLKQGMFLWREDELEGFFTEKGDFITTRPDDVSLWEKTGAFFSQLWKELPFNPYYWKSPQAKWQADRRDALIAWAKEAGQENPEKYVDDLLAVESKDLKIEAIEEPEGLRVPEYPGMPIGERVTQVPATRFLGEWVIPIAILSQLGLSALRGRAVLQAAKVGKPLATRVALETGRVALAPVAGYEWAVGKTIQGTYNTLMSSVLRRNLHSWAKGANVTIPKATEDAFIKQAIRELSPRFMAKETINTLFKPTKAGYTVTDAGARAAESAAYNAVRTSALLTKFRAEPAITPKAPTVPTVRPPTIPKVPTVPVGEVPPEPGITPTAEILASTAQKARAHIVAQEKALIDVKTGKIRPQYRRLAQNITGKKSMKDMTSDEASAFIDALEKYPEKKWSPKTGTWIPQPIPITKAIVPENYFNIKFGEPTPIRYFTSQNFYATKLGVGELTRPLELAKQKLDLEFPAWTRAVELKIKELNKVYKVTVAEKLIAIRNNIPTRAVADMAKLLNRYEDPPATLSEDKAKLFMWFRNVDRTILAGENRVRELLKMPLIPHRKAYLRHIADETAREIMQGNYSLPQDLAYWSKQIVGKRIFNPMSIHRKLSDDLLEHFSKDLNYITKSMIWTGLKEIHLSQPLHAFATQLNVLSKGMMPFSSLTTEELVRAQAMQPLPASTRKWLVDYVNQVIKGQQTELDASINRVVTQTGIGGVLDKLLKEFGRSVGTRPVTKIAQFSGRLVISATIGTKPRQIIRNLWQPTQELALNGIVATLKSLLPAGKTLTRILNNSMFLKSYARYEELPVGRMAKAERAWLWAYGKSAIFNARRGMKASFHSKSHYVTNRADAKYGWAAPERTYTEPEGYLYDSEFETLKREAEFSSGCTEYQYIAMGMPEIFRHKTLIPFTRLQSWWMNYFAKFQREALHRFWTGSVGWNPDLKLNWQDRLNWMKYLILGGAVLTAMGYKKSFMKDVLPHWGSPAAQFATGAYNYIVAGNDYEREKAKKAMFYSINAFVPGAIDYASWEAVWSGEKPLSTLFFYGEHWPPDMPTWGIPPLVEEVEIKHAIEFVNEEVPEFRKKLGTLIPAEDDIEEYTYEMSDFGVEIRALIRDIPPERVIEKEGFSDIVLMYKKAETLWDEHYYSLPANQRQEWLQQQTTESIWTGAYLALWGKLKVTGWVSGNPSTIALIRQLVEQYKIPAEAIPSLGELEERGGRGKIITPRTTEPTAPEGGLGVNPFR